MSSLSPTRRTVLRTAAWTVPAISLAATAPAFAASKAVECTVEQSLDFSAFATTTAAGRPDAVKHTDGVNQTEATWTVASVIDSDTDLADGATFAPVNVTFSTKATVGRLRDSDSNNNGVPNGHFRFAALQQVANSNGNDARAEMNVSGHGLKITTDTAATSSGVQPTVETVITFDKPVAGLSFLLTDIDDNGSNQRDRLVITGVTYRGAQVSYTTHAAVASSGSRAYSLPWTGSATSREWSGTSGIFEGTSSVGDNSSRGNLRVTTASSALVDTVTFRFQNVHTNTGARNNSLNVAQMSFSNVQTVCA